MTTKVQWGKLPPVTLNNKDLIVGHWYIDKDFEDDPGMAFMVTNNNSRVYPDGSEAPMNVPAGRTYIPLDVTITLTARG